jgi:hypothetical protein
MIKCVICKKEITAQQMVNGSAWFIMDAYSHKKCDEDIMAKQQPRILKGVSI